MRKTLTLHEIAHEEDDHQPLTIQEIDDHIRRLVPKLKWRLQYNGTHATTDVYAEVWERVWKVQRNDASKLTAPYIAQAIKNFIRDQKRARGRRAAQGFLRSDDIEPDQLNKTLTPSGERLVELQSDAMACALIVEALRRGIGMPSFMRSDTRRNLAEVLEAVLNNPMHSDAHIAEQLGLSTSTFHSRKKTLLKWLKPIVLNALKASSGVGGVAEKVLEGASAEQRGAAQEAARNALAERSQSNPGDVPL